MDPKTKLHLAVERQRAKLDGAYHAAPKMAAVLEPGVDVLELIEKQVRAKRRGGQSV